MKNRLREVLREYGISMYKLSKDTGISQSTINAICNNPHHDLKLSTLGKICDCVGCEPFEILVNEKDDTK